MNVKVADKPEVRPSPPAGPTLVLAGFSKHACRWCLSNVCGERGDHDRLVCGSELYARQTPAQRNACPRCSGDVRDGQACIVVDRELVAP